MNDIQKCPLCGNYIKMKKIQRNMKKVVADAVSDAEYVFTCPNCGYAWTDIKYAIEDDKYDGDEVYIPLTSFTEQRIKQIIAIQLDCEVEEVQSETDLREYSEERLNLIIHALQVCFNISISKPISEIIVVDDIIEYVTGSRINGIDSLKDEEYSSYFRFYICYTSYEKGMYKNNETAKLANMFEREANDCSTGIKPHFYCLAALVRLEYCLKEWFENDCDNCSEYEDIFQIYIIAGLDDIQKSIKIDPDDERYHIINCILNMLNDYFAESKNDKGHFVELYGRFIDKCNYSNFSRFSDLYIKVYDTILARINYHEAI